MVRSFIKSIFGRAKARPVVEIWPQGIRLELAAGETILQAALAQGVAYPHNCTVGTCGSCKTHLSTGTVQALSDFGYTLSRQELDAGYILACQAVPREAHTIVEITDPGIGLPEPESFTAQVISTEALTHDIVKMVVEFDRPLKFVAGQYASFKLPGMTRGRNYSFADAPQRIGSRTLSFFVRKVPGGEFTQALFAGRVAGQTLAVYAPHGSFRLRPGDGEMVCIAGGSGLAPLISVLEDMRKRRVRRPCTLLFGARTQADLYALETIAGLASAWSERFEFLPVLSHEPAGSSWTGARGWVTDFIARPGTETPWAATQAYLCGPPPMIDAGIDKLLALGIPLPQIHYDKFIDGAPAEIPTALAA